MERSCSPLRQGRGLRVKSEGKVRPTYKHRSVISNSGQQGKENLAQIKSLYICNCPHLTSSPCSTPSWPFNLKISAPISQSCFPSLSCFLHRTYQIETCSKIILSVHFHPLRCKLQRLAALSSLPCAQYLSDPQKVFAEWLFSTMFGTPPAQNEDPSLPLYLCAG